MPWSITSSAYRCISETLDLLAALAPTLDQAVRAASRKAQVSLDGTLPPIDRIAADRPFSREAPETRQERAGRRRSVRPAAVGLTRPATGRSRCARGPGARHRHRPRPGPHPVLGGQGLPGRPRHGPGSVPRPMQHAFRRPAGREPIPRQNPRSSNKLWPPSSPGGSSANSAARPPASRAPSRPSSPCVTPTQPQVEETSVCTPAAEDAALQPFAEFARTPRPLTPHSDRYESVSTAPGPVNAAAPASQSPVMWSKSSNTPRIDMS